MKNLFLFFLLIYSGLSFGQKYAAVVPVELPDSAGCGGKAKVKIYNAVAPIEFNWWDDHWQPSSSLNAEGLCDDGRYSVDITDSTCNKFNVFMKMHSDSSIQVSLDTVIIVMPSAPGMCDGEMYFTFNNILPIHQISFYASDTIINGQNFAFTNLCERRYAYSIKIAGNGEYHVIIDNRHPSTVSSPCVSYDASVALNLPNNAISCNGDMTLSSSSIADPLDYYYAVYVFDGFGATNINMNDPTNNYLSNICEGPHLIDIEAWNGSYQMNKRLQLFIPSNASLGSTWNGPDSLLPSTDTILLEAVYDCSPYFNQGIDTAYISSIIEIGNGQFEFGITMVQDTNIYTAYGSAIVDTSLNFFIDITIFCEDPSRTPGTFMGKRNIVYHGVKLNTNRINELENFNSIKIFPNPFESIYTLEFDLKKEGQLTFELTDISGKIISSKNYLAHIGKNQLDFEFSDLSNGLYLFRIISENGRLVSKKIIKN